jgi:hypothetical protein
MNEDDIKTAKDFIASLEWAKECGLELEFMTFFFEEFKRSKSVYESIWYANCEWDL